MLTTRVEPSETGVTLFVVGKLDFRTAEQFMKVAESDQVNQAKELWINFRETTALDSSAIGCLLRLHANSAKLGRKIVLTKAFGHIETAIKMANLGKLFTIVE